MASLWPQILPVLESVRDAEQITFATYDHFTARNPWQGRIVQIGDAAHCTSPQLGQGANMAMLDAYALSMALQMESDLPLAMARYARMRRWHVRLFQWASAAFTPFYQSDSRLLPVLRDYLLTPALRLPLADHLVARLVAGMTVPALERGSPSPVRLLRNRQADQSATS